MMFKFKKKQIIFSASTLDNSKYGIIKNVQYKSGHRIITVEWEDGGTTQFREDYLIDEIKFTKKYPESRYSRMELIESEKAALAHKLKYRFNKI